VDLVVEARSRRGRNTCEPIERRVKPARGSATGGERKDVKFSFIRTVWWVAVKREVSGMVESRGVMLFLLLRGSKFLEENWPPYISFSVRHTFI
jgi:hypothetical protein